MKSPLCCLEQWLRGKSDLSWAGRANLRNLMSGIFVQAIRWGMWKDANPAEHVALGRQTAKRERVLLTTEQTVALLEQLEPEVRLMVKAARFGALRISEVLGLQWKHVDFKQRILMIRQRYWRGNLDIPQSHTGVRDIPMGSLADELMRKYPGDGHDDEFVFNVPTYQGSASHTMTQLSVAISCGQQPRNLGSIMRASVSIPSGATPSLALGSTWGLYRWQNSPATRRLT